MLLLQSTKSLLNRRLVTIIINYCNCVISTSSTEHPSFYWKRERAKKKRRVFRQTRIQHRSTREFVQVINTHRNQRSNIVFFSWLVKRILDYCYEFDRSNDFELDMSNFRMWRSFWQARKNWSLRRELCWSHSTWENIWDNLQSILDGSLMSIPSNS